MPIMQFPDGYDRAKHQRMMCVRAMTDAEVRSLRPGQRVKFISNQQTIRELTINGRVRTWKRTPERLEVPVKYGLYEYATFDTAEALSRLVIEVNHDET